MLNVIMLSVVRPKLYKIIMLSVTFSYCYPECRYAECHYTQCHNAECPDTILRQQALCCHDISSTCHFVNYIKRQCNTPVSLPKIYPDHVPTHNLTPITSLKLVFCHSRKMPVDQIAWCHIFFFNWKKCFTNSQECRGLCCKYSYECNEPLSHSHSTTSILV